MAETEADRLYALYGTTVPPMPVRAFTFGRLSFEMVAGNLRSLCVDGIEVIRAIQYLVRDRDWGTLTPQLSDPRVQETDDALHISYDADCIFPDGGRLHYSARIAARSDGLEFTADAEAIDAITINRLGFCVLHPSSLAGVPLRVEHGDGSMEEARFPDLIDPRQPFTDIVALDHQQDGMTIECRLDGDSFEMEDHRNWSDASYKTYVRPLAKPWPYMMPVNAIDRQSVRVIVRGRSALPKRSVSDAIVLDIGEAVGVMPRIGLVVTPDQTDATSAERAALHDSGVQDLLLNFAAHDGHGAAEMGALAQAVAGLSQRKTLECVISAVDPETELQTIAELVSRSGLPLDAIAVYAAPDLQSTPPGSMWPDCPPLADIYDAARHAFPAVPLGGGMYSYFTELNRKRPPLDRLDFISHATCPIVHAADDLSVMQSIEAVAPILRSARAIIGEKPYRLGPITIGMRQNPYGSRTMPNPGRERIVMAMIDPRQEGRFAAAWTIGYVAATLGAGLDTITLGGLSGPMGLLGSDGPRPVFAAARALAGLAGSERYACRSSAPEKIVAIAAGGTILLANLTPNGQTARVGQVRIDLEPFEVATA